MRYGADSAYYDFIKPLGQLGYLKKAAYKSIIAVFLTESGKIRGERFRYVVGDNLLYRLKIRRGFVGGFGRRVVFRIRRFFAVFVFSSRREKRSENRRKAFEVGFAAS